MLRQPRGRPRKGCVWTANGWKPMNDVWDASARRPSASPILSEAELERDAAAEAARKEEEEDEERLERERQEAQRAADERERERLDAPRRQAEWSARGLSETVPVYYFDTFNEFQQLGKERKRAPPAEARSYRVVRKKVMRKVWGPDEARSLCAGEWELEERVVSYRIYG